MTCLLLTWPRRARLSVRLFSLVVSTVLAAGCSAASEPANVVVISPTNPAPLGFRSINGRANNLSNPEWGAAGTRLGRFMPAEYADGFSMPSGADRLSARAISNIGCDQKEPTESIIGASDFVWQWGQFLDHDISISPAADLNESMDIDVPTGDPHFDPASTGTQTIPFRRTRSALGTGVNGVVREQVNEITAWIDASNVYGSDPNRASALRTHDGTGRLKTSEGNMLPFNVDRIENDGGDDPTRFIAGDIRANENVGLLAMHTLFVREHNRIVDALAQTDPFLSGDDRYKRGRQFVGALMQRITYAEFLPAVLGPDPLDAYLGYDSSVEPTITNLFSTAIYRWGHSAIGGRLMRVDAQGQEVAEGHLALRDAFFSPAELAAGGGLDPILRGLASQVHQAIDPMVVDDLRNFLFGPPGAGGLDLASLNIQRGRDHGLPSYNHVREAFGLVPRQFLTQISSSTDIRERIAQIYDDVDNVDLWVGALSEDPIRGGQVGEVLFVAMKRQFEALRDGDRFWYTGSMSSALVEEVNNTTLADVIRRNTGVGDELQDQVFYVSQTVSDN